MEDRHDDLDRRQAFLGVHVDRNAAPVVLDRTRSVLVQDDPDVLGVAGERFVDRVVDGFVHELVEAPLGGVADVHAGALANSLEAFENLDLLAGIVVHFHYRGSTRDQFCPRPVIASPVPPSLLAHPLRATLSLRACRATLVYARATGLLR